MNNNYNYSNKGEGLGNFLIVVGFLGVLLFAGLFVIQLMQYFAPPPPTPPNTIIIATINEDKSLIKFLPSVPSLLTIIGLFVCFLVVGFGGYIRKKS